MLEGKKVLVIHPFIESIQSQYKNRKKIFDDYQVLSDFELILYKPVQSIAGNYKELPYDDWFDALENMKNEISKIDFDIAIIGCGAYGMPLAYYVKKMGKKAVHLGGATQLLFGIIGKRWEEEYNLGDLTNKYWVRPKLSEKPKNFDRIENGCYW